MADTLNAIREPASATFRSVSSRRTPGSIATGGRWRLIASLQRASHRRRRGWLPAFAGKTTEYLARLFILAPAFASEYCDRFRPHRKQGRREGRASAEARGPRAERMHGAGTTGTAGPTRPSLRDGFHAYSALSPVSGLLATVVVGIIALPTWRQHRGARTTQLHVRKSLVRPHAQGHAASPRGHRIPASRLVTIAKRPLQARRDEGRGTRILERRKRNFWRQQAGSTHQVDRAGEMSFSARGIPG